MGSFTSAGGRGVTTARLTPEDGALHVTHHTEGTLPDPSYLALRDGWLYAVSEREAGAVAAFSRTDPDRPALVGEPEPVAGDSPTHLALAGARLATANYGSGSVSLVRVQPDGTLQGPAQVLPHRGSGPDPDRQSGPHAHAVLPDPTGRWLLSADLGTDSIWVYDLAEPDERPRLHAEVPLEPGSGPRQLAFHPDGRHVYVTQELLPRVTVCAWDGDTGTLRPVSYVDLRPPESAELSASDAGAEPRGYPSQLVVAADGRYAWVAVRGHDSIVVLEPDTTGDELTQLAAVDCGGHWPRDLSLHPTQRWLYAANERSGDVTWFAVDPGTGTPRRAGSLTAPGASCVVFA
ncbi:lactonase family protein [Streptomyces oceani]|uniref:3-carboxymuconate cyclase n=1 Tax=Streptomyces oceani TaxID=1075402 RepID=A0A1E7JY38_9ACTN|nr:lactonase family protein [Streptomyces oceani]OEU96590.1 hypothetical protein AN216_19795 [Streptomyces oceani]